MKRILLLLTSIILIAGCNTDKARINNNSHLNDTLRTTVLYARGFTIKDTNENVILTIRNPWQLAKNVEFNYLLSDSIQSSSMIDEYTWAIKTPVKRAICLSTTHLGFIEYIHMTGSIIGISGSNYIVNSDIRKGIAENHIFDVGYDEGLNFELILNLKPDVVFAYGVSVAITNTIKKLNDLGIPVILIGEYLEQDPLAKMEWVKVFASCYGITGQVADQFNAAVLHYKELSAMAAMASDKPSVLLGLPYRGNWYISGSKSYVARLIKDAGGKYIFDFLDYNESRPMGLEMIYEHALTADFWINPGEARSKKDILSVDGRFGALSSLKSDDIYNNDNLMVESGGNAFYESGVVEPDIILSDLIFILHPQLLPSYSLKYYRKLE